ncbi:MAG: 50S ribosomal protein L10 [Planctomycetales bacterium 12-60-4]|nr:MAG: 50S ribosomal protein L10 [Planctomycetales bacterium 12-60-4]
MSKVDKNMMIADLQAELGDCREVLVVDVSKMTGVATNKWRLDLQKKQIRVLGVRNAIAGKALSDVGLTGIRDVLQGPSAIVWGGEDIVALAKEVTQYVKDIAELQLKGGAIGDTSLDAEQVDSLSKSPGRRELLSQIAGLIRSPGGRLAGAIQSPGGKLAGCVKSLADKEEAAPAA